MFSFLRNVCERKTNLKNNYSSFFEQGKRFSKRYGSLFVSCYIKENCQREVKELIAQAEDLKIHKFRFTDKWDMEPCSEAYILEDMIWDISPNGDPEWVYMLNRHDYLYKLYLSYCVTGDKAYVDTLKWYLLHWVKNNEILPQGSETTRTIDTGIRCMNWQFLMLHLAGEELLTEAEAEVLLHSLYLQYESMRERYIGKYTLSNWGILQTTAICMGYLLFEEYLPQNGMKEWSWKELERQLELQIMDDGAQWEQSMMYHMEVLLCCMKLLKICKFAGMKCPWLLEAVNKMSNYVMHAAAPDHLQVAQCDSDVTDVRDILVKAAVLTENPEYKFAGYEKVDFESAWLLGRQGILLYESLGTQKPEKLSLHEVDTGNIYYRSDWSEKANYTYLTCGTIGSGHGHADLTHLSLYYHGKSFLVDSGRYSYREDEPLRVELKKAHAHNVCVVDDCSMGKPNGSWSYFSYANAMKNYHKEKNGIHFTEMCYQTDIEEKQSCTVIRRVMSADIGIWLIVDDICCDGKHLVNEYYHLDADVTVESPSEDRTSLRLKNDGVILKVRGMIEPKIESCDLSYKYNELTKSKCIVKTAAFEGRFIDWTCFLGKDIIETAVSVYQFGNLQTVDSSVVVAKKFVVSKSESWTFLIWNKETFKGGKLYICEGIPVYAKAAAIHKKNEKITLVRLKN